MKPNSLRFSLYDVLGFNRLRDEDEILADLTENDDDITKVWNQQKLYLLFFDVSELFCWLTFCLQQLETVMQTNKDENFAILKFFEQKLPI